MLPLVRNQSKQWRAGWCTYPDGFDENPDIEILCGGENEKTSRAAACWRQGNLLHFGFEQSPAEMNESGQKLLLNCVAYISRFNQDRPIAVTPSVFAGNVALPRAYLDRRLGKAGDITDAASLLNRELCENLKDKRPDELKQWYLAHRSFFHPDTEQKLGLDPDAILLDAPIDRVEFFDRTVKALSSDGKHAATAKRLLARYAPPDMDANASVSSWQKWIEENRPYLFFSDQGDYRWYIDPLAKQRAVPSSQLRGPARASR